MMRHFSINEFEQLSGIKKHTIRVWEARYKIFSPGRTRTNVRYYTIDDLRQLLSITLFIKKRGYRISKLAGIAIEHLEQRLQSFKSVEDRELIAIDKLLVYMFSEDIDRFEAMLDECIQQFGLNKTIHKIIIPFLERANVLSYQSSETEVHFAVAAVRKKIIFGIESTVFLKSHSERALLFLPEDEHYDLILLYINYMLKMIGVHVFYLGTDISISNIEKVVNDKKPTLLFCYVTGKKFVAKTYSRLLEKHPDVRLYVFHPHKNINISSDSENIVVSNLGHIDLIKEFSSL